MHRKGKGKQRFTKTDVARAIEAVKDKLSVWLVRITPEGAIEIETEPRAVAAETLPAIEAEWSVEPAE